MPTFSHYSCFDPQVDRPLAELSRQAAKAHFDLVITTRQARLHELRALLKTDNVELNGSEAGLQHLNEWFAANVERDSESPERLKPIWYSVVHDVAVFLGEEIIHRAPTLRWDLCLHGRRNLSFQRPVLAGFTKVANPKYTADLDFAIGTYAHRLIHGNESDRSLFPNIVRSALEKA